MKFLSKPLSYDTHWTDFLTSLWTLYLNNLSTDLAHNLQVVPKQRIREYDSWWSDYGSIVIFRQTFIHTFKRPSFQVNSKNYLRLFKDCIFHTHVKVFHGAEESDCEIGKMLIKIRLLVDVGVKIFINGLTSQPGLY